MKKVFLLMFALVLLFLCGCSSEAPQEPAEDPSEIVEEPVEEPSEPEEPKEIVRKMPSDDELLSLLEYQVILYERGNYGRPLDRSDYVSWQFAAAFSDDIGATDDDSGRRQPLIRLMYDKWMGIFQADYFSYVSPADADLEIEIKGYEISDEKVSLTVERIRDGVDLVDSKYVFVREEADEEILSSEASSLTLGGYYWRYESVEPFAMDVSETVTYLSTPEDIVEFCEKVNAHDPEAVNGHYVLKNDIDMTGVSIDPIGLAYGNEWFDDALKYAKAPGGFNGIFDGQGFKIYNVDIVFSENDPYGSNTGFFGQIGHKAYIQNLTVCGSVSDGGKMGETQNGRVGGFAGKICSGAFVENCRFEGTVDGYSYVGGFAGQIGESLEEESAKVTGCSSDAVVIANIYSGGFAGMVRSELRDCEATGTLKITNKGVLPSGIGGFVGDVGANIVDCKSAVRLEYEYKEPNRMGNFAGELGQNDITGCIIDPNCLHEGWYLVGMQWYKGRTIDIKKEDWYEEPEDFVLEELGSGVTMKVYD